MPLTKRNCDIFTKRGEVRVQNVESILTLLCAETDLNKAGKIKARKVLIKRFHDLNGRMVQWEMH